jgi:hypothetical protein
MTLPAWRHRRLTLRWSKREDDWIVHYPSGPDGHLMYGFF